MFWSPIVRISSERAKYNTIGELTRVREKIESQYGLNLELVINDKYVDALSVLKNIAAQQTAKFNSSVMRVFQIEKNLERHIQRLKSRTGKRETNGNKI